MDELLEHLQMKIKAFVDSYNRLQQAHQSLTQGKLLLLTEKESLAHKQQQAVSEIETLIAKLKTIEKTS